jgi:hypothetical protein
MNMFTASVSWVCEGLQGFPFFFCSAVYCGGEDLQVADIPK